MASLRAETSDVDGSERVSLRVEGPLMMMEMEGEALVEVDMVERRGGGDVEEGEGRGQIAS